MNNGDVPSFFGTPLPEGTSHKIPFNQHFPMIFPMVSPWFSHGNWWDSHGLPEGIWHPPFDISSSRWRQGRFAGRVAPYESSHSTEPAQRQDRRSGNGNQWNRLNIYWLYTEISYSYLIHTILVIWLYRLWVYLILSFAQINGIGILPSGRPLSSGC